MPLPNVLDTGLQSRATKVGRFRMGPPCASSARSWERPSASTSTSSIAAAPPRLGPLLLLLPAAGRGPADAAPRSALAAPAPRRRASGSNARPRALPPVPPLVAWPWLGALAAAVGTSGSEAELGPPPTSIVTAAAVAAGPPLHAGTAGGGENAICTCCCPKCTRPRVHSARLARSMIEALQGICTDERATAVMALRCSVAGQQQQAPVRQAFRHRVAHRPAGRPNRRRDPRRSLLCAQLLNWPCNAYIIGCAVAAVLRLLRQPIYGCTKFARSPYFDVPGPAH